MSRRTDLPTSHLLVFFIDNNDELLRFTASKLSSVYDFHVYNNSKKAAEDLKSVPADLVICKQDMPGLTGSELCNMLKTNYTTQHIKFILMTDTVLTALDMKNLNITLSADDYLSKPFNLQEAVTRFNKLLGYGPVHVDDGLIEGSETRRLEGLNSSMTTATESLSRMAPATHVPTRHSQDDEIKLAETTVHKVPASTSGSELSMILNEELEHNSLTEYSMSDVMDVQLLKNIEQYVVQNMSRGQISMEEMAKAMGMGRIPFFHKIRSITNKTPAELVRDLRLKHACILLKRTNINMSELATNVGFLTAENFIKVFKEKFGLSPLEYRLKHRGS